MSALKSVSPEDVFPVPLTKAAQRKSGLQAGPTMPGKMKPARDGRYLRYFEDVGDWAFSEFSEGIWTRDGFFASDVQDAPWRGGVKS
jgi:hypothetical protein